MPPGVRLNQPQPQPKPASTSAPAPSQVDKGGGDAGTAAGTAAGTPTAGTTNASTFEPAAATTNQPAPAQTQQPQQPEQPQQPAGTEPAPPPFSFSATINSDRAKATRDALQKLVGGNAELAQRLTPAVIDTLVNGVATPRTESALGQEGVLGRRQAMEAARTLGSLPQPVYDRVSSMLTAAGKQADGTVAPGASAETERALILKAVAARSAALSDPAAQEQALGELEWFAGAIRGQARGDVIAQTSPVDVDDRANTSAANPLDSTTTGDQRADNDGYAQRFTTSCAPAVAMMIRGEADPVFALMLNSDGLQNGDPAAGASQLERQVLERDRFFNDRSPEVQLTDAQMQEFQRTGKLPPGIEHLSGAAVSRVGEQARKVMDEVLDAAVTAGTITKPQAEALRKDAQGGTLTEAEQKDRDVALAAARQAHDNHPTDFELAAMRSDRPRENFMLIAHALRDLASGVTHQEYWNWNAGADGMNRGMMDNVERALAGGLDLPIRLSTPGQDGGHFMMLTDVRSREGGERQFLVSDPWSGRSTWLNESELGNPKSDWPRREFNVFWKQVSDVFAPIDFPRPEPQ